MLQIYYNNGLIFLTQKVYGDVDPGHLDTVKKSAGDDGFIRQHILDAPIEYLGGSNVKKDVSTNDLNQMLRRTGYPTAKNVQGMPIDLFSDFDEKGVCSCCGETGSLKRNVATIFPLESEWGKSGLCLAPPERRLRFCKRCAFLIYSGMAGVLRTYSQGNMLRVIFDSTPDVVFTLLDRFKGMDRDETRLNSVKLEHPTPYEAHEMLLFLIYRFIKLLRKSGIGNFSREAYGEGELTREGLAREDLDARSVGADTIIKVDSYASILRKTNMHYILTGKNMRDDVGVVEGETLWGLAKFFYSLEEVAEKKPKPDKTCRIPSLFEEFMKSSIVANYRKENCLIRYRNSFCNGLLNGKVYFETLCELAFEKKRLKDPRPIPSFYYLMVLKYLEAFQMKKESDIFERLNAFGESLGEAVKGKSMESFVWEIYRARGFEDLLNVLSELQLKLGNSQNWGDLYSCKENWKTAKAIVLNGMMNAIAEGKEVSQNGDNST